MVDFVYGQFCIQHFSFSIRRFDTVNENLYFVVNKVVTIRLAEKNNVIYFSQSYGLFTTTCSEQVMPLAETDHVICFSQSHGYYTMLLLSLLRSTSFCLLCRNILHRDCYTHTLSLIHRSTQIK